MLIRQLYCMHCEPYWACNIFFYTLFHFQPWLAVTTMTDQHDKCLLSLLTYRRYDQQLLWALHLSLALPPDDESFSSTVLASNAIFDDCYQNKDQPNCVTTRIPFKWHIHRHTETNTTECITTDSRMVTIHYWEIAVNFQFAFYSTAGYFLTCTTGPHCHEQYSIYLPLTTHWPTAPKLVSMTRTV